MTRLIALCGACLLLAAAPATASVAPTRPPAAIEALLACRTNANETERLACYDAAVTQVDQAVRSGSVTVIDRAEARRMRRSLFGFSVPNIPFLSKDGQEEVKTLTTTVRSASRDSYGKWTLTLEDGAVWRTTEPLKGFREPKKGTSVTLHKGLLGAYWLSVANDRQVGALRVR